MPAVSNKTLLQTKFPKGSKRRKLLMIGGIPLLIVICCCLGFSALTLVALSPPVQALETAQAIQVHNTAIALQTLTLTPTTSPTSHSTETPSLGLYN